MYRRYRTFLSPLLFLFPLLLSSCGKKEAFFPDYKENSQIERQEDNISIHADITVPDTALTGKVTWARGETMNLLARKEELKDDFLINAIQPQFSQKEDTLFFSWSDYLNDKEWSVFAYNNSHNFFSNNQEYQYRSACISLLPDHIEYNRAIYQQRKDLDFMTEEAAVSSVRSTMEKYGIHLGEPVAVYAMDHQTMQSEEDITDLDGNPQPDQAKPEWTIDDDTYYFFFYQEYEDIPMMYHMYSQQGFLPGEEATVMLTKQGIIDVSIQGCYDWFPQEEVSLISAEQAAETFFQNRQGIYDNTYQVDHISLMMDIISGVNNTVKLWPVWVFDTQVFTQAADVSSRERVIIDAVTGREMPVNG